MRIVLAGIKVQAAFQLVNDQDEVVSGRISEQVYASLTEFAEKGTGALREAWEALRQQPETGATPETPAVVQ